MLEASAFIVWNVGRRSPIALVRDVARSVRDVRAFFAFVVSFAIGIIFVIAAAVLVLPAVANPAVDFAGVMTATLVVALALEFLVGDDVRALVRS